MTKTRALGLVSSLGLIVGLFVVLPGVGADETQKEGRDGLYRPLGLFTEVVALVRSNYVEPVEMKPLMAGAFAGITEAMDPFSEYVPPEKMGAFEAAQASREKGDTADVGIVLARRFGYPVVVAAIAGSPAAAAGVKSDDLIEKVDDQPARGLSLWEMESRLAGKPGARVRLLVVREGKPRHRTIDIVRASYNPAAPAASRVSGEIVVSVPTFLPGTAGALKKLLALYDRAKPLILDLRSNAVGSFDEAARSAALFVPPGPLGELKGRKIEGKTFRAEAGERLHEGRVVLLIDSGTAGGAELFASALKERGGIARAASVSPVPESKGADGTDSTDSTDSTVGSDPTVVPLAAEGSREGLKATGVRLVGESTFGMGFTSRVVNLASGGALRVSVGKLRTVSGHALSPKGLDPDDRVLAIPPDDSVSPSPVDPVLQRGLKILSETAPQTPS